MPLNATYRNIAQGSLLHGTVLCSRSLPPRSSANPGARAAHGDFAVCRRQFVAEYSFRRLAPRQRPQVLPYVHTVVALQWHPR